MIKNIDLWFELTKMYFPEGIFDYFELTKLDFTETSIEASFDEKNETSEKFSGEKLTSKGFYPEISLQDFPIRDKILRLHIRRRRWTVESSGEIVSNDWNIPAKGTRYTKGFAAFLKGLLG